MPSRQSKRQTNTKRLSEDELSSVLEDVSGLLFHNKKQLEYLFDYFDVDGVHPCTPLYTPEHP